MQMKRTRILVAQEKSCIHVLEDALAGYDVVPTTTLQEAERMLIENGIDLIVIGIHFDDSRAMELVKYVRDSSSHKKTPIIVVRYWPSDHAKILRQTMDIMKSVHAISAYIEADADEKPFIERVRSTVDQTLPVRKRVFSS
jgi:PleD family two-component response regulator